MSVVVAFTGETSPVTVTCSLTAPTCRLKSRRACWPTTRWMPPCTIVWKPSLATVTSYAPTASSASR